MKNLFTPVVILFSFLSIFSNTLYGQADNLGTEFWLMFNQNFDGCTHTLYISGPDATSGQIDISDLAFSMPFSVTPGVVTEVVLPSSTAVITNDVIEGKGVHITSNDEVSIYGLNQRVGSTDAFLGIPVDVLGLEYIIMSYDPFSSNGSSNGSSFGIVGVENGTNIMITTTANSGSRVAGTSYNIVLNAGETYQLKSTSGDLTGTEISSDKPISVFGTHVCANVPSDIPYCDHLVEQLPDITTWGKSFYTSSLATRTGGDIFRILASKDGTDVSLNGAVVATINKGAFYEVDLPSNSFNEITANNPIFVVQYSKGRNIDGQVNSDPFMMIVVPHENYSGSATFTTPNGSTFTSDNWINIITPNQGVGIITLDGVIIPNVDFTAISTTEYSGARIPISQGSHTLSGNVAFGTSVYGFAFSNSYGYPANQLYAPVASAASMTIDPMDGMVMTEIEHCISATVKDIDGNNLEGIRVDFNITGVNTLSGFALTDENGVAAYCYTSTDDGIDTVAISTGSLNETATVEWSSIPVPTMGQWGLMVLFLMIGIVGLVFLRKPISVKAN